MKGFHWELYCCPAGFLSPSVTLLTSLSMLFHAATSSLPENLKPKCSSSSFIAASFRSLASFFGNFRDVSHNTGFYNLISGSLQKGSEPFLHLRLCSFNNKLCHLVCLLHVDVTYFRFSAVHSWTMLRQNLAVGVLHASTPSKFGQQCCKFLNRFRKPATCCRNKML